MPDTLTRLAVRESTPFLEAAKATEHDNRILVTLITPGQGSSGYYPQSTLEAAGRDGVFPAGLHMYVNHQTAQEWEQRPEGDVNGLAAVLLEDAYWDAERGGLVAEARVFRHWAERLKDLVEAIGVSIRAYCDAEIQDIDGVAKNVVTRIHEAISVDFVTHAGRGGLYEVMESVRRAPVNAATRRGMKEATANARRAELTDLVRDAYAGEKTWTWVRDYDEGTVWFEVETPDDAAIWQQSYDVENDRASALTGDRVEVRVEVRYVPVNATTSTEAEVAEDGEALPFDLTAMPGFEALREAWSKATTGSGWVQAVIGDRPTWITATDPTTPAVEAATETPVNPAGNTTPVTESEEDAMSHTQIEESKLSALEEAASRVPTLEAERDKVLAESKEKDRLIAVLKSAAQARTFAENRIREANKELPAASVARIVAEATRDVPMTDDLRLDLTVLGESVDTARKAEEQYLASVAEESGLGQVKGLGEYQRAVTDPTPDEEAAAFRAFSGAKG